MTLIICTYYGNMSCPSNFKYGWKSLMKCVPIWCQPDVRSRRYPFSRRYLISLPPVLGRNMLNQTRIIKQGNFEIRIEILISRIDSYANTTFQNTNTNKQHSQPVFSHRLKWWPINRGQDERTTLTIATSLGRDSCERKPKWHLLYIITGPSYNHPRRFMYIRALMLHWACIYSVLFKKEWIMNKYSTILLCSGLWLIWHRTLSM